MSGLFLVSGCTPYIETDSPGAAPQGLYHRVAPGETLWSISKSYGVELRELVRVNRLSDGSRIKAGQRLFIPEATSSPRPQNGFIWPVEGKVISIFGMRRGSVVNKGIDIQAPSGAEVVASRDGRVSFVHEEMPGFGKTIILDHGEGYATVYAYVREILVNPGDRVAQRQVIARVGRTGRAEVPALHFEIRRDQKPRNPFHYLP